MSSQDGVAGASRIEGGVDMKKAITGSKLEAKAIGRYHITVVIEVAHVE